jgi:hypothetical protein
VTLPDVEAIVATYLAAHSEVDALVDGRVGTELPENAVRPYLTVTRVGGRPRSRPHWIDQAHLQVVCWGQDPDNEPTARDEAFDVCATALAALHDLPGITDLGIVTGVEDILGPRPLPDRETAFPRFLAEVLVTAHPLVAAS